MQIRSLVHGPNGRLGDGRGGAVRRGEDERGGGQEREAKVGVRTGGNQRHS